ncbi:transcriptional repressor [bacterium]|jgi:Fur family ferric uptake transcriptional regulator|nr:transcriptional repressor [bacterium]
MAKQADSVKFLPCGRPRGNPVRMPTQKQMEAWQQQLRSYLVSQGLKYTDQRWKIAELILSTGGHLDAQAIVDQVRRKHSDIGPATVYRNIKVLCDALILKESLTDAQGRVVYELFDEQHHDHIICIDCGEICEFHDQKIEQLQNAVLEKMNFRETRHRHVIYAHCTFLKD